MPDRTASLHEPIIIVGAGVFGLSSAIHLAKRGYKDVTVFDKQPYDQSDFSYFKGADAASADINKIIRSAYGGVSIYRDLTLEAIDEWKAWNADLSQGKSVPRGMKKRDRVFIPNGNLIMTDADKLPDFDQATVDSTEAAGFIDTQLVMDNPRHRKIAKEKGLGFAIDPFHREQKGMSNTAVLDTTGGTAVADKACRFALHQARELGVKFVLHPEKGALQNLNYSSDFPASTKRISGITTRAGNQYPAVTTILACGSWTPSILPQLDNLCEATAGTVALIKIPRSSPLYERLGPDHMPSWQWKMRDGAEAGLYGFARDEDGWLKIGYRGTKFTNPVTQGDGKERSVPITRWSEGERITAAPRQGIKVIQKFMDMHLPELAREGLGITMTRLCWYNDSYDNHLVIDRVPATEGLLVATGGSGHAFKYLPVIGKYVVDVVERKGLERGALQAWRWRQREKDEPQNNVLMEGSGGERALGNISLMSEEELKRVGRARL